MIKFEGKPGHEVIRMRCFIAQQRLRANAIAQIQRLTRVRATAPTSILSIVHAAAPTFVKKTSKPTRAVSVFETLLSGLSLWYGSLVKPWAFFGTLTKAKTQGPRLYRAAGSRIYSVVGCSAPLTALPRSKQANPLDDNGQRKAQMRGV